MIKQKLKLLAAIGSVALLIGTPAKTAAQTTNYFNFDTSLGSGTVTLNINNLTVNSLDINSAAYHDVVDTITFNGITYGNLYFSILNDFSSVVNGQAVTQDGFAILARDAATSVNLIQLFVAGDQNTVNGLTTSDMLTVLNNFSTLLSGDAGSGPQTTVYLNLNYPEAGISGTISSFAPVPEPSTLALAGLGSLSLLLFRRRK